MGVQEWCKPNFRSSNFLLENLENEIEVGAFKSELFHLANSCVDSNNLSGKVWSLFGCLYW